MYSDSVQHRLKWRIGDLGRYRAEDRKRPRFEVINASKEGITVWYGGERKPRLIPLKTFKQDCVNWWDCQAINRDALPKWFSPGVRFSLHGRGGSVVQATVHDTKNYAKTYHTIDVRNAELELRRVRFNFASCLANGETLVLVDLKDVLRYGFRRQTRWDKLQEDDLLDELFDLYDDY